MSMSEITYSVSVFFSLTNSETVTDFLEFATREIVCWDLTHEWVKCLFIGPHLPAVYTQFIKVCIIAQAHMAIKKSHKIKLLFFFVQHQTAWSAFDSRSVFDSDGNNCCLAFEVSVSCVAFGNICHSWKSNRSCDFCTCIDCLHLPWFNAKSQFYISWSFTKFTLCWII